MDVIIVGAGIAGLTRHSTRSCRNQNTDHEFVSQEDYAARGRHQSASTYATKMLAECRLLDDMAQTAIETKEQYEK